MSIYSRIYHNLCESRRQSERDWKPGSNLHRHHIVPKHSGGDDSPSNFTYLTVREHIIAHFLLWKMNRNPNDLRGMKMLGAKITSQQRKIIGEWCRDNKIGFHGATPEERTKWAKNILEKEKIRGKKYSWWWWSSSEGRKERARRGGVVTSRNNKGRIWISKNDSSKRVYENDLKKFLDDGWSLGVGYKKSKLELTKTKERAREKVTCPHCKKEVQKISSNRYHFDKCKFKSTEYQDSLDYSLA